MMILSAFRTPEALLHISPVFLLLFFLSALFDITRRSLPIPFFLFSLGMGIIYLSRLLLQNNGASAAWQLLSFLPGLIFLLLSHLTERGLGKGDGYFLLVAGLFLKPLSLGMLVLVGLMVAGGSAAILLIYGKLHHSSMRYRSIPFLPCLLTAFLLQLSLLPETLHAPFA